MALRKTTLFCLLTVLAAVLHAPAQANDAAADTLDNETQEIVLSGDYHYKTEISGEPEAMKEALLPLTETQRLQDDPPPTLYLLKRRMDKDTEILTKALHAKGYYDARVATVVEVGEDTHTARFVVTAGEVYTLQSIRLDVARRSNKNDLTLPETTTLGIAIGSHVDYSQILSARSKLRNALHNLNCLRSVDIRVYLRADTVHKTAEAIYRIRAGEQATFGALHVNGLQTVERPYIDRKVTWRQGECFKPAKVEDLQVSLLQSNLFSVSEVTVEEKPDAEGQVGLTLEVRERKHRTVKVGLGYATEEGLDIKPAWEHRNFMGQGEKLTVEGTLSTFLQSIKTKLEKPDFKRKDQKLVLEGELSQSTTDAYDSTSIRTLAQVSRPLGNNLTGALGVAYALKRIDDEAVAAGEETFSLVSFPSYIQHNTRNSDLDPTDGHLLRFDVEPFLETMNSGNMFFKTQGNARFYHQHASLPGQPTWAFRAMVGSIIGSANTDIPADERFYSGGGGSVRGYGYQMLGPLLNGSPTGGRSLVEFSGELRMRVTESIGVVPFFDAGNVYEDVYPEFNGDLFYAAGLGLRYYTDFGPFRFDFAVPLDKRQNVDDSFQIYLSFGQSF